MKNFLKIMNFDMCFYIVQILLGIVVFGYGIFMNSTMFLVMGIAFASGGIGSVNIWNNFKKRKNVEIELFDERADFISGKSSKIAFKCMFVMIEVLFLILLLPIGLEKYLLIFIVGGILLLTIGIYFLTYFFIKRNIRF